MAEEFDDDALAFAAQLFDLAREGHSEQLVDYLEHGLSPDLTNSKGDTLLLLAAYYNHPDTVRALLAHGADTERVNDRGQTPLAAAVFRQSAASVAALVAAGADPSLGDPNALATATFFELPDMLALLPATR